MIPQKYLKKILAVMLYGYSEPQGIKFEGLDSLLGNDFLFKSVLTGCDSCLKNPELL